MRHRAPCPARQRHPAAVGESLAGSGRRITTRVWTAFCVEFCTLYGLGLRGPVEDFWQAASGSQAFDFIFGGWRVHNRKLRNVADPAREEWVKFDAASHALPILHGTGHVDRIYVPDPPDADPFEGFTVRMFDPAAGTWSIWWSSTRAPGRLDPPVVGRFTGNHAVFECDDIIGEHAVKVRFEAHADAFSPTWQQSFSYDSGSTWKLNWKMTLTRGSATGSQEYASGILPPQTNAARAD